MYEADDRRLFSQPSAEKNRHGKRQQSKKFLRRKSEFENVEDDHVGQQTHANNRMLAEEINQVLFDRNQRESNNRTTTLKQTGITLDAYKQRPKKNFLKQLSPANVRKNRRSPPRLTLPLHVEPHTLQIGSAETRAALLSGYYRTQATFETKSRGSRSRSNNQQVHQGRFNNPEHEAGYDTSNTAAAEEQQASSFSNNNNNDDHDQPHHPPITLKKIRRKKRRIIVAL